MCLHGKNAHVGWVGGLIRTQRMCTYIHAYTHTHNTHTHTHIGLSATARRSLLERQRSHTHTDQKLGENNLQVVKFSAHRKPLGRQQGERPSRFERGSRCRGFEIRKSCWRRRGVRVKKPKCWRRVWVQTRSEKHFSPRAETCGEGWQRGGQGGR